MSTKKQSDLQKLNEELLADGIETIADIDYTPERTAYLTHLEEADYSDKDWVKLLKILKNQHKLHFHKYVADTYPHLRFEIGEDKTYWLYNEETGVYDEINFITVRGLVIKMMVDDGLDDTASEVVVKNILSKYRAMFLNRGSNYDDFDCQDDWFHAKNGWVNVDTLKFQKHTPDRLSKRSSAVSYKKNANCKNYDHFLDTQMQLKPDQVRAIDQFSGLLLTPDITYQKMLVLIGKPGSGKSTLLDCWSDVLGDCAVQSSLNKISTDSFARFGGVSLVGKQLCWFDEVEVTRSNMSNSLINLVTGQNIEVERKGISGFVYPGNQLKCVLTANTLPRSAEMGIYRRMLLIHLEYSFYDSMTVNHDIRNILNAEASGILNRMLKGLADLRKMKDFVTVEGHAEMIEEYKTSSNTMSEFLDYHFVFDEHARTISSKVLLAAYQDFATDRYSDSLTPQRFGMALKHHGLSKFDKIYSNKDSNGFKEWHGLGLKDAFEFNSVGLIREKSSHF